MSDLSQISLDWQGPAYWEHMNPLEEASVPGVYLWLAGGYISYVGQSNNIRNRVCEEISQVLGGWSKLYRVADLEAGSIRDRGALRPEYNPTWKHILGATFQIQFQKFSLLAMENMKAYRIFWAHLQDSQVVRESVESALIYSASHGQPDALQNERPSRTRDTAISVSIANPFPPDLHLGPDRGPLNYPPSEE